MQVPFIGVNPDIVTDYKISYQLEPLYRNDQVRAIDLSGPTIFMPLGENAFPMENMVLLLHMTIDSPTVDFTLQKGSSHDLSHTLVRVQGDTNGAVNVTTENNYVEVVERYHFGNELTLFIHMNPPAYFNVNARSYYLSGNLQGSLVCESLLVNGYFYNHVNSLRTPKPKLDPHKCCADHDIAGPYEWPEARPELIWTHWGQTNITFRYIEEEQPYLLFEDLD